jgi:hypothetical protein
MTDGAYEGKKVRICKYFACNKVENVLKERNAYLVGITVDCIEMVPSESFSNLKCPLE